MGKILFFSKVIFCQSVVYFFLAIRGEKISLIFACFKCLWKVFAEVVEKEERLRESRARIEFKRRQRGLFSARLFIIFKPKWCGSDKREELSRIKSYTGCNKIEIKTFWSKQTKNLKTLSACWLWYHFKIFLFDPVFFLSVSTYADTFLSLGDGGEWWRQREK